MNDRINNTIPGVNDSLVLVAPGLFYCKRCQVITESMYLRSGLEDYMSRYKERWRLFRSNVNVVLNRNFHSNVNVLGVLYKHYNISQCCIIPPLLTIFYLMNYNSLSHPGLRQR